MDEDDLELKAMGLIATSLKGLDQETVGRVLDWATKRFRHTATATTDYTGILSRLENLTSPAALPPPAFKDFPGLFDATNPDSVVEKALVAGYWFQVVLGQDDFDSQSLNRELKHLGHPSSNITRDLDGLMSQSPRLVIQTRKSGSAKQARKQYKLTTEGIRVVQKMLDKPR